MVEKSPKKAIAMFVNEKKDPTVANEKKEQTLANERIEQTLANEKNEARNAVATMQAEMICHKDRFPNQPQLSCMKRGQAWQPTQAATRQGQPAHTGSHAEPRGLDVVTHSSPPENAGNIADNNFLSHDKSVQKASSHKAVSFEKE